MKKKSPLTISLIAFAIILVAVGITVVLINSRPPPEKVDVEERAFLVDAIPVYPENVEFVIYSQGNVNPRHQTRISTQVSGTVESVAPVFVEGGFFNKGDVLLRLEKEDYLTEVQLAESQLAQAQAALEEEVARGKVAEEEWKAVKKTVPPALGLRKPQLAREQANVKAAKASLARAQRNLARTEIRAPYNGLVVNREADIGQFLPIGSVVGELFATDVAEVRLPLTNSDLAYLDLQVGIDGQNEVTLQADVAGKVQHWTGKLVRSEGVMDAGSRVMHAIAEVNDPYQLQTQLKDVDVLRFGQFVQAVISGTQAEDVFVLPRNLLRLDDTVVTVTEQREVKIKPVDVARSDAERVYIRRGLRSGDLIATSAVPNAYDGLKVRLPGDEPEEVSEPKKGDQPEDEDAVEVSGE